MSKMTYEEAKQMVAAKRGYEMWAQLEWNLGGRGNIGIDLANREAAEMLAKSWANEAVKEDRNKIIEGNPSDIFPSINGAVAKINMIKLNKIPLPYPEIEP